MNVEELIEELECEVILGEIEVKWLRIGVKFDIEETRKKVFVRSRTTPLSLTESVHMQDEIEREKMEEFLDELRYNGCFTLN